MGNTKSFVFLIVSIACIKCTDQKGPLEFYSLPPSKYGKTKAAVGGMIRTDYYILKNFEAENSNKMNKVDSFVAKHLPDSLSSYASYQILFYKYTKNKIDEDFKHDNKNLIEWYGNALIIEY